MFSPDLEYARASERTLARFLLRRRDFAPLAYLLARCLLAPFATPAITYRRVITTRALCLASSSLSLCLSRARARTRGSVDTIEVAGHGSGN